MAHFNALVEAAELMRNPPQIQSSISRVAGQLLTPNPTPLTIEDQQSRNGLPVDKVAHAAAIAVQRNDHLSIALSATADEFETASLLIKLRGCGTTVPTQADADAANQAAGVACLALLSRDDKVLALAACEPLSPLVQGPQPRTSNSSGNSDEGADAREARASEQVFVFYRCHGNDFRRRVSKETLEATIHARPDAIPNWSSQPLPPSSKSLEDRTGEATCVTCIAFRDTLISTAAGNVRYADDELTEIEGPIVPDPSPRNRPRISRKRPSRPAAASLNRGSKRRKLARVPDLPPILEDTAVDAPGPLDPPVARAVRSRVSGRIVKPTRKAIGRED